MWTILTILPLIAMARINGAYKLNQRKKVLPVQFVDEKDKKEILETKCLKLDENTKCSVCGERVTFKNLGAIRRTESETIFVCTKHSCMSASLIISS
ncbi:hypothetical protein KAX02_07365 [candidate division WOR-3 bacterium]|nr:hypothetical protein [candidate division WOR-3 bacterium]